MNQQLGPKRLAEIEATLPGDIADWGPIGELIAALRSCQARVERLEAVRAAAQSISDLYSAPGPIAFETFLVALYEQTEILTEALDRASEEEEEQHGGR